LEAEPGKSFLIELAYQVSRECGGFLFLAQADANVKQKQFVHESPALLSMKTNNQQICS
jgi:hypothetical protein